MNITGKQLKEVAKAGGMKKANELDFKISDGFYELGVYDDDLEWQPTLTVKILKGNCSDDVIFNTDFDNFDEFAARKMLDTLGLVEME